MKYTHSPGDRPLTGYTIREGLGRGGFGEVYHAVSDGGKEVALKLVQRNWEVELRGVSQCLNLKHHNLVAVYDVKQAENGDYWIVMELMSGESLDKAMARYPEGMPQEEIMRWLRGICEGVGFLHERGIVHRDLKPGNVFVENGVVKILDYGLSKFISASRRSGQTGSVGTVHYMAPEVSRGRYGKEVDLYAIGIILYEMVTCHVPFDGESPGEILMKHLTEPPNLNVLPPAYRQVVARLLDKEPGRRYASVHEMLDALEGRETVREDVPVLEAVAQVNGSPTGAGSQRYETPRSNGQAEESKRLERPKEDRVIAGVCSGLGNYLGWDIGGVRLLYALLTIFTGFVLGIVAYIVLALVMPDEGKSRLVKPLRRSSKDRMFAGLCGGLADYLGTNVTAVRVVSVILAVFTGFVPFLVVYIVMALIIQSDDSGTVRGGYMATSSHWEKAVSGRPVWANNEPGRGLAVQVGGGFIRLVIAAALGIGAGLVGYGVASAVWVPRQSKPLFPPHKIPAGDDLAQAQREMESYRRAHSDYQRLMLIRHQREEMAELFGGGAGFLLAGAAAFLLFFARRREKSPDDSDLGVYVSNRGGIGFGGGFVRLLIAGALALGAGLITPAIATAVLGIDDGFGVPLGIGAGFLVAGLTVYLFFFRRDAADLFRAGFAQTQTWHATSGERV